MKVSEMGLNEACKALRELENAFMSESNMRTSGVGAGFRKASYLRNQKKLKDRIKELDPSFPV